MRSTSQQVNLDGSIRVKKTPPFDGYFRVMYMGERHLLVCVHSPTTGRCSSCYKLLLWVLHNERQWPLLLGRPRRRNRRRRKETFRSDCLLPPGDRAHTHKKRGGQRKSLARLMDGLHPPPPLVAPILIE